MSRYLSLVALASTANAGRNTVTPVEKVITLVAKLIDENQATAHKEAAAYNTFAVFCKGKTESKSESITSLQDAIETNSANIAQQTSDRGARADELVEAKTKRDDKTKDLEDTTNRCDKARSKYDATDADTSKALSSIENALASLSAASATAEASLMAVKAAVATAPPSKAVEEAMRTMDSQKWSSFLQVDPTDPKYKFHAQPIINLLEEMQKEFTDFKTETDSEWKKTSDNCESTSSDLNDVITATKESITSLEGQIDELSTDLANEKGDLAENKFQLEEEELYLKDLTKLCEDRANEFDQRSAMFASEDAALTEAHQILTERVEDADGANERAVMLQKSKTGQKSIKATTPVSFVQTEETDTVSVSHQKEAMLQFLANEGRRLQSPALLSLVARAGADPFKKVKELIQKLMERLIKEATAEATKKGFCDTELAKAEHNRDHRYADTRKLASTIGKLESKHDTLVADIADLEEGIQELKDEHEEMTYERFEIEKLDNRDQINLAKEGRTAVKEALDLLKNFYKQSAKAKVFLQASPVAEDDPGVAHTGGAYKGNQAASKGIIGLLETILTDFEHTITTVTEEERQQAASYVVFDRDNKVSQKKKDTKRKLNEEDKATTERKLDTGYDELQNNQDRLDKALKELVNLQPTCIDTGMSYEDRKAKREAEIEALKTAKEQLMPK